MMSALLRAIALTLFGLALLTGPMAFAVAHNYFTIGLTQQAWLLVALLAATGTVAVCVGVWLMWRS